VFGFDYADVATALDRSEEACRQLVSRARRRVGDGRPRVETDRAEHRRLVERFLAAARGADLDGLTSMLAADARLVSDGGPHRKAARRPIVGRERVVRFVTAVLPRLFERCDYAPVLVNGEPGFALVHREGIHLVGTVEVDAAGAIAAVRWVLNPEKLPHP
jgi:RNA polymerase sigma-70 factor (ECF subfamily)